VMSDDRPASQSSLALTERPLSALDRTGRVRSALKHTVRNLRSSSRRRRGFDTSAFSRRRGASLVSNLFKVSFVLLFLIPSMVAAVYFGFLASSQYATEAKFVVQGGEPVKLDAFTVATGMPSLTAVQDTQVVTNYIEGPSLVRRLEDRVDLRKLYGNESIDWFSRFDASKPFEKLAKYWKTKVDVSIQLPGGIVTFDVRAFTAEDALRIADEVLSSAEELVNDINRRMMEDNVAAYRTEFERAAERLGKARVALEVARNTTGILDPGQAAMSLGTLLTNLKGDLLALQQEYDSQKRSVGTDAPQMRAMANRMKVMADQIKQLEAQMTGQVGVRSDGGALSVSITRFSELEVEHRIAEQQYVSAAASLELARVSAERRLVYLKAFLRPSLPQEPRYPRRILTIFSIVAGSFIAWATLCGLVVLARNHMA
jgi:capsular polysaccharide transport system permease protein